MEDMQGMPFNIFIWLGEWLRNRKHWEAYLHFVLLCCMKITQLLEWIAHSHHSRVFVLCGVEDAFCMAGVACRADI